MTWCGFIDLLGTKESANASELKLRQGLSALHATLREHFPKLSGGLCYAFSDGAFFQTTHLKDFVAFYIEVRKSLFSNGHFFKCSIIAESLSADYSDSDGGGTTPLKDARFLSITFGGGAPKAYLNQDKFKGVGATVDLRTPIGDDEKNFLIKSAYVDDKSSRVVEFYDVKFSAEELGPTGFRDEPPWETQSPREASSAPDHSFLDIFLREVSKIRSRSKRYSKYYVSTIISMLRSSDFSQIEYDGDNWRNAPYLFEQIFGEGRLNRIFSDTPWYGAIYWSAVDEIYRQNANLSHDSKERLMVELLKLKTVFRELDAIPAHIADSRVRDDLMERKARFDASIKRS